MEYVDTYKCFSEINRLRILNLLIEGPLCVCHVCEILAQPQPKVSRLLASLKELGGVESERHLNWIIYRLPEKRNFVLEENLKCIEMMRDESDIFRADLKQRIRIVEILAKEKKDCPLMPTDGCGGGL